MKREIWEQTKQELFRAFNCTEKGLSSQEAARRQAVYGENRLRTGRQRNPVAIFFGQFRNALVLILLLAAAVSALLGDGGSAAVILVVVTMNAVVGTVQTVKAASSLESLRQLSAPTAKVLRQGGVQEIPGWEVVPGDIVVLEAGDAVCADGRVIECAGMQCDESALTGESQPVEKITSPLSRDTVLGERRNMAFSGTFLTYGRGRLLVTATGRDTEMGRIADLTERAPEKRTPLQISLDQFGRHLSAIILVLCAVIFAFNVALRRERVMDAFLFAVALAVAAIPEALGSIVTIVLSFGTRQMARERAVIRRLQAVEGLGSVSVICSDKTGTLTQNRMTVRQLFAEGAIRGAEEPSGEELLQMAVLCSDAGSEVGDPTETALVRLAQARGMDVDALRKKYPRAAELPFDSRRKCMSTVHRTEDGWFQVTKGAPDVLLERCTLSPEQRKKVQLANESLARQGLRVLAVARRWAASPAAEEKDLEFLGLAAMMDPPRPESKAAVESCIAAGIRPVMITGDHRVTAAAIAREVGILHEGELAVDGSTLEGMSDAELRELVPKVSVYARVTPEQKLQIVRAWQARDERVAMTGDGVNDAPALRQADIGVAMGSGSEAAREAADMVLTDDHFATIVRAVENGRNLYSNIQKAIGFLLSGNLAAILTVLYAALAGLPQPFAAVQLLFINLLTDSLPAIALGLEKPTGDVMREKPRRSGQGILSRDFLRRTGAEGAVLSLAVTAAFLTGLSQSAAAGSTMAFAALCLSRLLHGFNCKTRQSEVLTRQMLNNRYLLAAFAVGCAALAAVLVLPGLSALFDAAALTPGQAGTVVLVSLGSMAAIQAGKAAAARKQNADGGKSPGFTSKGKCS